MQVLCFPIAEVTSACLWEDAISEQQHLSVPGSSSGHPYALCKISAEAGVPSVWDRGNGLPGACCLGEDGKGSLACSAAGNKKVVTFRPAVDTALYLLPVLMIRGRKEVCLFFLGGPGYSRIKDVQTVYSKYFLESWLYMRWVLVLCLLWS